MRNALVAKSFLDAIDEDSKTAILSNIAAHYQVSAETAYKEVTHDEAEYLLEYITGPERAATSLLMKRHGFTQESVSLESSAAGPGGP